MISTAFFTVGDVLLRVSVSSGKTPDKLCLGQKKDEIDPFFLLHPRFLAGLKSQDVAQCLREGTQRKLQLCQKSVPPNRVR